jgi:serine protease inhibitor
MIQNIGTFIIRQQTISAAKYTNTPSYPIPIRTHIRNTIGFCHSGMDDASRIEMAKAVQIAARKVVFKRKEESAGEAFRRIKEEKEVKINRGVKRAAKQMLKKKQMKKVSSYFIKK